MTTDAPTRTHSDTPVSALVASQNAAARRHDAIAILGIVAVGVLLRSWGLQSESLSMDEIAELQSARGLVSAIVHAPDGFPPLFGLLLHAWYRLFDSDQSGRWLAVIVGSGTIPVIWRLAIRAGGPRAGLIAALALALSPFHVAISREIRAYALVILIATGALWLFWRAMTSNGARDWAAFVAASAVGLLVHYYFVLLVATTALIVFAERRARREVLPAALAHIAIGLVGVACIGLVREDLAYQSSYRLEAPFTAAAAAYAYLSIVVGSSIGPSVRELHSISAAEAVRRALPWACVAGVAVAALVTGALTVARDRTSVMRLAALALIPVVASGVLASVLHVGFRVRYLAWIVVPLLVLVAMGVASPGRSRTRVASALALVSVWVASLFNARTDPRYWNEDVRTAATELRSRAPSAPVFVIADYMAIPIEYYLDDGRLVCALPSVPVGTSDVAMQLDVMKSMTPAGGAFVVVYTRPFHADVTGALPRALERTGWITSRRDYAGITVFDGRRSASDAVFRRRSCAPPNGDVTQHAPRRRD